MPSRFEEAAKGQSCPKLCCFNGCSGGALRSFPAFSFPAVIFYFPPNKTNANPASCCFPPIPFLLDALHPALKPQKFLGCWYLEVFRMLVSRFCFALGLGRSKGDGETDKHRELLNYAHSRAFTLRNQQDLGNGRLAKTLGSSSDLLFNQRGLRGRWIIRIIQQESLEGLSFRTIK